MRCHTWSVHSTQYWSWPQWLMVGFLAYLSLTYLIWIILTSIMQTNSNFWYFKGCKVESISLNVEAVNTHRDRPEVSTNSHTCIYKQKLYHFSFWSLVLYSPSRRWREARALWSGETAWPLSPALNPIKSLALKVWMTRSWERWRPPNWPCVQHHTPHLLCPHRWATVTAHRSKTSVI